MNQSCKYIKEDKLETNVFKSVSKLIGFAGISHTPIVRILEVDGKLYEVTILINEK